MMKRILSILFFLFTFSTIAQEEYPCYSINEVFTQMEGDNPSITKNFVGGWNMFGYPCSQSVDLAYAFSSIVDKVIIVKDNSGNVYMPEFGFNGIGFLEGGEGYQIKMTNTEYGFSFCEHITWPNLEGCTDCEAVNFNQWANVDDGSCNYDSDGDGVPDSEEVVGCQDSLACDYNINATDSAECYYAQENYDCDGNLLIYLGAEAHGGIVFYYDSIGEYGLVAATEDIENLYAWGCSGTHLNGADNFYIGGGAQNTSDILLDCFENDIAAKLCNDFINNGYDDWFLPSINELERLFYVSSTLNNFNLCEVCYYWSSTEDSNQNAWIVNFIDGNTNNRHKDNEEMIRPIRAFGNWIEGCMSENACNYNPEANMADNSCVFPEQGYDCDGNEFPYFIGQEAFGGIIFWIDGTGEHGLVAASQNIGWVFEWGCGGTPIDSYDTAIGSGLQNSLEIVSTCSTTPIAASEALAYENEGYTDWYLPSKDELLEMMNTIGPNGSQGNIGNFPTYSTPPYWASTVYSYNGAWSVNIYSFAEGIGRGNDFQVRPIRSF